MPSGYEMSRDYGAPPPSPFYIRLGVLAILTVAGVIIWNMWPATHDCREVPTSEIEAIDGKAIPRLDKLDLKPGECVTIRR